MRRASQRSSVIHWYIEYFGENDEMVNKYFSIPFVQWDDNPRKICILSDLSRMFLSRN